ncbi:UvrD-helicase domain-containing protein [Arenibacter sp. 6A1]|uniref:UvrD-helicase domain-containing protein n=1 Tax=Arenibacter sp. 6A1 TaxID=2720391 RepID=UPI0014481EA6|nr:UvrD-helicase domain-containing protein [Arenibacter sp. 6A1]NKI26544.1 UvrD-helicase domain-containing protein [Arenibacter sp. 6A1]
MQDAPYKIYNASAGSGKTYTLAKEYLKIILSPNFNQNYRNILAITFTNKAVNEMKQRILGSLFTFSQVKQNQEVPPMLADISKELDTDAITIGLRAKKALKEILHNYAFFDVSTIDKFTHRLIRTFAKDLKLPQNFEVVLDTDLLLDEAIAKLLNKAGSNKQLTKVLVDFALEKIDDDKSWDVSLDLHKIGRLLFNENQADHLKKLEGKSIDDFLGLKKILVSQIKMLHEKILEDANAILGIINDNGLDTKNFKGGYFPKFIIKIAEGTIVNKFDAQWQQNFATDPLYAKTCKQPIKDILDGLHPTFVEMFEEIKENIVILFLVKNSYSNIVPLTVLNAIQQEIKALEKERDILPISSFNRIISNEIKDQPAPFIYERIGEKYRHYFIDEFQDTSEMQWNNLIPLVANALEGFEDQDNKGSLLLVGDAKQAIYRWRGGKAEQFLNLISETENPFVFLPSTANLPANYRSHEEVIKFNNDFFTTTSQFLENEVYQHLFLEGNQQEYNRRKGGLVQVDFIEDNDEQHENEVYCEAVLKSIEEVREKKYPLKDICILTRKRKHGVLLADFLTQKNIPIISSETLLLNSSPKVRFLVNLLQYSLHPEDLEVCFSLLSFLSEGKEDQHRFIHGHLQDLGALFLEEYSFNIEIIKHSSVYDGLEYAIKKFQLANTSDAYLTYLMDVVLEIEQKEGTHSQAFLAHWEKKKGGLSITAPENLDAVQIMTVHKSKGLEFPIVIFPFANTNIYEEIDAKLWLQVDPDTFGGFEEILINKKQEVLQYGEQAGTIYNEEQHKLELDAFNILYVALTRAEKALYVITKKDVDAKGNHKTNLYSGLFIHYLKEKNLWEDSQYSYVFGALETNEDADHQQDTQATVPYLYTHKDRESFNILTNAGALWDTTREDALSKGNLLHHILGEIETEKDIDNAIAIAVNKGDLPKAEVDIIKNKLHAIVQHPKLKAFYKEGNTIKNEQDIITKEGAILRPDRLVIQGNKATIIDYKTGKRNPNYYQQLYAYADVLVEMDYKIEHKIIVYINEDITLEFI